MKKLLLLCSLLLTAGIAGAQCTASLGYTQAPVGNNLLNVNFTNNSSYVLPYTGQRKSFNVDYGDGTQVYNVPGTSVASHVYSLPGTYTVGFRIRDYDSASGATVCTDSVGVFVTVAYPPCGSTITVSGTGATKTFAAATPAGATNMVYNWNYGDGFTGAGTPAIHTYANSGTYTVTLTATMVIGTTVYCTYTNVVNVVVYIPPPALNCSTLSANFVFAVSGAVASFTNSSSVASSAYQTIATWNYGDGTTGAGYNTPPHTYSTPGVYPVKLVMNWKDSLNTTSCRDSITKYVTITTVPSPANIISGNVIYDTTGVGLKYFYVYLIKLDTATNILSAVDSMITGSAVTPYYSFGSKPAGSYRTKAAEWTGTGFGTGFIPTYHDSSLYWSTATVINHTGGSTLNRRIYMHKGSPTTGTGFIGGNVSMGANKGGSSGVGGLLVYLRDANMRVVQTAVTDASGNYGFNNIKLAPYSIWPERINYYTTPKTPIVLNATYPTAADISFNMDDSKRSIVPRGVLGVNGVAAASSDFIRVSPVPATGSATIIWNGVADATAQFTLTSITGEVVARTATLQGHTGAVSLNLSGIAQGIYFVHGSGSLAGKVARLVVQ